MWQGVYVTVQRPSVCPTCRLLQQRAVCCWSPHGKAILTDCWTACRRAVLQALGAQQQRHCSSKCTQCRIYRLASLCITVIAETVTITQWNVHRFTQSTAVNATESKALEKCSMCYSCLLATSQVDWENELNRFARSNQFSPHILILFSVLWQCMHFLVQLTSTELMQATAKL